MLRILSKYYIVTFISLKTGSVLSALGRWSVVEERVFLLECFSRIVSVVLTSDLKSGLKTDIFNFSRIP